MLRDIAAAQFDMWNDCHFPDMPPIHPARDSVHRTVDDVCRAWSAAIDHTDTITGERALSLELFRACQESGAKRILAKAEQAENPSAYVKVALRNAKIQRERKVANGTTWHPNDALAEIHDMMIGAVVPKATIRKLIKAVGPDRAVEIAEQAAKIEDEAKLIAMIWSHIPDAKPKAKPKRPLGIGF